MRSDTCNNDTAKLTHRLCTVLLNPDFTSELRAVTYMIQTAHVHVPGAGARTEKLLRPPHSTPWSELRRGGVERTALTRAPVRSLGRRVRGRPPSAVHLFFLCLPRGERETLPAPRQSLAPPSHTAPIVSLSLGLYVPSSHERMPLPQVVERSWRAPPPTFPLPLSPLVCG